MVTFVVSDYVVLWLVVFQERESPELDMSDDDELAQAFDMHSLIISSLQQEPMFTAEDVINEIEDMMQVCHLFLLTPRDSALAPKKYLWSIHTKKDISTGF